MKYLLLIIGISFHLATFSQEVNDPIDVTLELQKKLKMEVEREVPKLKQRMGKEEENAVHIEFTVDTFRIERFRSKWIELDYRDFGMSEANYAGAELYDGLLNKYYKKLLGVLKEEDKKTLQQTQRAWLAFRDSETKLVGTISKEEYSGGGTMQGLTESSMYLDMVRRRTIELFDHYVRATQCE
jgi:uncharacterized protein YecT (DUF1311 family)